MTDLPLYICTIHSEHFLTSLMTHGGWPGWTRPGLLFLVPMNKTPDKSDLSRRGYFGSQFEDRAYHGRERWQIEYEAVGHLVSTVRKQREADANSQLTFSFLFSPGPQPRNWCGP